MYLIEKSKWIRLTAQLLSLLMVFSLGSCAGCYNQGDETQEKISMKVPTDKKKITGSDKTAVMITNEEGEESEEALKLADYKLHVTIIDQKGGTGSQLSYTKEEGGNQLVKVSEINETLDKFKGQATLKPQATKKIEIGVVTSNPSVTWVKFKIELVKADGTVLNTEEVEWNAAGIILPKLTLTNVKQAEGGVPGEFSFEVSQADIKPSEIQVSFEFSNDATFQFGHKKVEDIKTLADLLGNDNVIQVSKKTFALLLELLDAKGCPAAKITISLQKDGQELLASPNNQLSWVQKDLGLRLNVNKKDAKTVTYTVTKKSGVEIEDTDQVELYFSNKVDSNKAQLDGAKEKKIALKDTDFTGDTATKDLVVNLDTEVSAEFEFDLLYHDVSVLTPPKPSITFEKDVQLSIQKIICHKKDSNKVKFTLQNAGSVAANNVTLAYELISGNATIGGKKRGELTNLTVPDKASHTGLLTSELGVLEFGAGEVSVSFKFMLKHGSKGIEKKSETFTTKDFKLALMADRYNAANSTVAVEVTNTGTESVGDSDKLTLDYTLDNDATLAGETSNTGSIAINTLDPLDPWKKNLTVDLKGKASAGLTLVLKLNGEELAATTKTVECKEDVLVAFVNTTPIDLEDPETLNLDAKNEGKNGAAKENLKVRVTRQKGATSTINGQLIGVGASIDLPAVEDLGAGRTAKVLDLTIDLQRDEEIAYSLQLVYRDQLIPGEKLLTWKKGVPQFTIALKDPKTMENILSGEATLEITNNSGSALEQGDLDNTTFNYRDGMTVLDKHNQIARGKSLAALGFDLDHVGKLDGTQSIKLKLTRDKNTREELRGIKLMHKDQPSSKEAEFSWPAAPKITLMSRKSTYDSRSKEMLLILRTDKKPEAAVLQNAKLKVTVTDLTDNPVSKACLKKRSQVRFNESFDIDINDKSLANTFDISNLTTQALFKELRVSFVNFPLGVSKIKIALADLPPIYQGIGVEIIKEVE